MGGNGTKRSSSSAGRSARRVGVCVAALAVWALGARMAPGDERVLFDFEVAADVRAEYERIRKRRPRAVLAVLRQGQKGFNPADPDEAFDGWRDAGTYAHPPMGLTMGCFANRGKAARIEVWSRVRPCFIRDVLGEQVRRLPLRRQSRGQGGEGSPGADGDLRAGEVARATSAWRALASPGGVSEGVSFGCPGDTLRDGPAATEGDGQSRLAATSAAEKMCPGDTLKCLHNRDLTLG